MDYIDKKNDCLYFIQSSNNGMIKIGRSKDPERRLNQLQTGSPHKLKLICFFKDDGHKEKFLHETLKKFRIRKNNEWFDYKCVGSIPEEFYEKIPWGSFDDWWEEN